MIGVIAQPDCVQQDGSWCARVYRLTGNDLLARHSDVVISTGLQILFILLLAVLTRLLLHRAIHRLTRATAQGARRAARAQAIGSVLRSATTLVVYGVAATMMLGQLGITLGPIIASAGIIGLAFGFGAQNLVKDFLSGMFMMIEDQYGVGDWVDLGEASGTVEAVGMRVTTLRDESGTVWYVRNGEVQRVGNSNQGHSVAVVDVPIGHGAAISAAIEIAQRVATELTAQGGSLAADVLEPPEVLGVESITPEGVTLRITVKVRAARQWAVQRTMLAAILGALADADVPPPSAAGGGTAPADGPAPPP
ncbi:MAG: mechanosensitive ion channel family protein [Pseudonocardiaceae bacterium]